MTSNNAPVTVERTLAAGRIIDIMTGGKFDWRSRLGDSDFLESADWMTALAYADAALAFPNAAKTEWRCFHCGDVFTDERCARLHFGRDEDSEPACVIKAGAEQGLLGALREAEYAAADARQAIADESTDAAKSYYAQATRHATALRNAEEAGYERGLADGRSLASAPAGKLNRDFTARRIKELIDEGDGFWRACSGCQESCDGYVPERDYPFDPLFRCQPGGGCSECGGIGVLWDDGRGYEDITGNEDPILIEEEPILIERRADAECGCPEELWEAYGAHLHMHLNAGSASNAHADFGDGGEVECEVTATTVDLARAAFFGWAKALQGGRA